MNPKSWKEMVSRSREVEAALGDGIKVIEENEKQSVVLQRRCIRVTKDLPVGHIICQDDITALRPAPEGCFTPFEVAELLGKNLNTAKLNGDAIFKSEINND